MQFSFHVLLLFTLDAVTSATATQTNPIHKFITMIAAVEDGTMAKAIAAHGGDGDGEKGDEKNVTVTRPPWTPNLGEPSTAKEHEELTIDKQMMEVLYLPTAEPTLSPDRQRNYNTVDSPQEMLWHRQLGAYPTATPAPERDCARTPIISNCGCPEMIKACSEAVYECEVNVEVLSKEKPDILKDNYAAKFDHPLLNTFLQRIAKRSRRFLRRGGRNAGSSSSVNPECRQCIADMARQLTPTHNDRRLDVSPTPVEMSAQEVDPALTLLQEDEMQPEITGGFVPGNFGWRVDGPPAPGQGITWQIQQNQQLINDIGTATPGFCGTDERTAMGECINYFWTCDRNRKALSDWARGAQMENEWIWAHPMTRPGIYAGMS
eukprot:gnl/TRDRNA2_/TRDRNA2_182159_c0_seq1.p1 gnl/TRDRNA2_/TRDRNA2_182159_c0~~gnl/TRDRNA2_/TRDRNA2_182159_c0_seq1.p1  ORF type:complete len:377 (+),score=55.69 gnl/TRDRNA2_/TRDRNA2_182159_c0_seq1:57-1187(+)